MALTLGLAAWAALTLPLSYWPGGSASFLLKDYSKTVALFWLLSNVVDTLPRLRRVAWCLSGLALPLALSGVKNFLSGSFQDVGTVKRIVGYEAGLIQNPNDLALALSLILPLTVALLLASRDLLTQLLLLVIALLQAVGVIVTFSRAGFLTLAVVVTVYVWRSLRRGRTGWAAIVIAAVLAGITLLPPDYLARLRTIASIDSDPSGSAQVRWSDSMAAVRFVLANPLIGGGIGMNTLALNEVRGTTWTAVHNVYLEYAVELGLPGLALFLMLFLACLRKVRMVRRRACSLPAPQSDLSHLAEGIEISLLGFAVSAFFYPVAYHFYFYYLAGLAVAAGAILHKLAPWDGPGPDPWFVHTS
jgi:O-antigen ligase